MKKSVSVLNHVLILNLKLLFILVNNLKPYSFKLLVPHLTHSRFLEVFVREPLHEVDLLLSARGVWGQRLHEVVIIR